MDCITSTAGCDSLAQNVSFGDSQPNNLRLFLCITGVFIERLRGTVLGARCMVVISISEAQISLNLSLILLLPYE